MRVELYEGLDHLDAARDERLYSAALEWLVPGGWACAQHPPQTTIGQDHLSDFHGLYEPFDHRDVDAVLRKPGDRGSPPYECEHLHAQADRIDVPSSSSSQPHSASSISRQAERGGEMAPALTQRRSGAGRIGPTLRTVRRGCWGFAIPIGDDRD